MDMIRCNEDAPVVRKAVACGLAAVALAMVLAMLLPAATGASTGKAFAATGVAAETAGGANALAAGAADEVTYPIVYRLKGGTQAKKQVTKIAAGATVRVASLKKPKRAGCKFLGWYKNAALTKKATTVKGTASASKRTLYAKWRVEKYPIVFKLNGGKNPAAQTTLVKVGKTLAISKLKKPTRSGYKFLGWYSNKALTKSAKKVQGVAKKSKRQVYAKWRAKTYNLTYMVNGGKLSGTYTTKYTVGKSVALPTPVKARCKFAGWCTNKKLTKNIGTTTKALAGTKKLYAKWVPITYSIAYILDGGKLPSSAPTTYSFDSPVNTLPTPTKAGYSFQGWYSDANKTKLVTSIPSTSKGNKKLYASWRERVLVAHRGLTANAPENSVKAITDAAAKGFKEVEFDVRFTSDGAPVLVHNETVKISGANGTNAEVVSSVAVASLPYENLQSAAFAQQKSGTDGNNLATFEEAMEACKGCGVMATVHMKTTAISEADTLMSIVEQYGMQNKVRWFSTDLTVLRYVRSVDPDCAVTYSHSFTKQAVVDACDFAKDGDVMISTKRTKITKSNLALCKQAGLAVRAWSFADETAIAGVDPYISSILIDNVKGSAVPDPVIF